MPQPPRPARIARLLLLLLLLPLPVAAEPALVADAFGLARVDDRARAGWAGWRGTAGPGGRAVAPGPVAQLSLVLGEKSLTAGRARAQAAALALDGAGNMVADGTTVTLTLPGGPVPQRSRAGIAARVFAAGTRAGRAFAGAAAGGVQSLRADYVVIPDLAGAQVALAPDPGGAEVESLHEFVTPPLQDPQGNALADGTGLMLLLRGQGGAVSQLAGVVVGGRARFSLLARDLGGAADLAGQAQVVLGPHSGAPQPYGVAPLRGLGAPAITAGRGTGAEAGIYHVTAGPFLTAAGWLLTDGAPLHAELDLDDGRRLTASGWLRDGMARFDWIVPPGVQPLRLTLDSPLGRQITPLQGTRDAR